MVKIIGVCFKRIGKVYFFNPGNFNLKCGDKVIVETARGLEFGHVKGCVREVSGNEIVAPLKKVVRVATEKDIAQNEKNLSKKARALALCQEKIEKHNLGMKLIDVEHTFDNTKIIFYFSAEGRVDFRDLVKDLATIFRTRIELRQIGVRDEAKMLGGIGTCGRSLCCHSWQSDFAPVSIKMAKIQNLSLNPVKISGACGRLMCCLKYENDTYQELKKGMPNVGDRIETQDGLALVLESNVLMSHVKTRLVLEEKTATSPQKLSTEFYAYKKDDIKRIIGKKKSGRKEEEPRMAVALPEEIKALLEE
ncbi:MAG: stage 0 sporulation family protein [Clostridiales Family XIII bacterium]|jgi:cell fate regulator YaaT (PSP1 superfamily)|nr:stage 0 sporulation family protein [Clostridiales Family XIII bacterium]